jgi:hypothetical protein
MMQSLWIISVYFFSDELLNNIVVETNRYARQQILELQLSLRSIWSSWSDVSVPGIKAFLGLIINMGVMPLNDVKAIGLVSGYYR